MKAQTTFSCSNCNAQYPKWTGRCLECGKWGTITEEIGIRDKVLGSKLKINEDKIVKFETFKASNEPRIKTGIGEVDRVMGGGIVEGSLTLLGGEPGIGKSTIVLQIAEHASSPLLYVSGEESANQLKLRVDRLGFKLKQVSFIAENNLEMIIATLLQLKPKIAIIDSIQTMYSSELPSEPGNVSQVRICTVKLLEVAKQHNIALIIIGHVTKEGQVAGPKTLEHLVDTVLYLESSEKDGLRLLRSVKNRFGSTDELGVMEMTSKGLIEVTNTAELFWERSELMSSGTITTCMLEGSRPFIVEVQALVTKTQFGYAQRRASGFDSNRLQMLIAVMSKRLRIPLETYDVHLNVTGGFKINEPAADLAVCLAIYSSFKDLKPSAPIMALGEVGLGGEIRSVSQLQRRIDEAKKLKFEKIIAPDAKSKGIKTLSQAIEQI